MSVLQCLFAPLGVCTEYYSHLCLGVGRSVHIFCPETIGIEWNVNGYPIPTVHLQPPPPPITDNKSQKAL